MAYLYDFYTVGSVVDTFTRWDGNHTTSCLCDYGYTGPACDMRLCPKGDDPLTPFTDYRTIEIETSALYGTLDGSFSFTFNGESFSFPAAESEMSVEACEAKFESLNNVQTAKCAKGIANAAGGNKFTVQLRSFPVMPYENNVFTHDGNPPLSSFHCGLSAVTGVTGPSCDITDAETNRLPEYAYCSNRGKCDFVVGKCMCYDGFVGPACADFYRDIVSTAASSTEADVLTVRSTLPSFTSSIVKVSTTNGANSAFNFIEAVDNFRTIFQVRGDGDVNINYGGLVVDDGGQTINQGGLVVSRGGLTVQTDGMTVTGGLTLVEHGIYVQTGGLSIGEGGLEIHTGGLRLTNGFSVQQGGLHIVQHGITVDAGGATITSGGVRIVAHGASVQSGGMKVRPSAPVYNPFAFLHCALILYFLTPSSLLHFPSTYLPTYLPT
jgi:hypothetical protein